MKHDYRIYLPGMLMVALGLLVISVPEVLAILFASLMCITGMLMLYLGHLLRKREIVTIRIDDWNMDSDFINLRFQRHPGDLYYRER